MASVENGEAIPGTDDIASFKDSLRIGRAFSNPTGDQNGFQRFLVETIKLKLTHLLLTLVRAGLEHREDKEGAGNIAHPQSQGKAKMGGEDHQRHALQ